jgi:hypothetical protein
LKATTLKTLLFWVALTGTTLASTYGSVEPIVNPAVLDTDALQSQSLDVREAFAERALECGVVDRVMATLISTRATTTINALNTRVQVGAGGFMGRTNPTYVYTIIDRGPNAASHADIRVLTDSLGYVLSQASAFLLDADDTTSYDFPAQYVVLNFTVPPSLRKSAALFETVGRIDPDLFATDSSGYTQYGRAYLSLQSFVSDEQFIAGYVEAAARSGVEYTPVVNGVPALFAGGAAFPGNDWTTRRRGEDYLARIPAASHQGLKQLRNSHLLFTRDALRAIDDDWRRGGNQSLRRGMSELRCRYGTEDR